MPHKDPAAKRHYMRMYYRAKREEKRAKIKAWKRAAFQRDPEGTRAKWRTYRATVRARAALLELEQIKAERPKKDPGYRGTLRPNGF